MHDDDSPLLRAAAARLDFLEHGRSGAAGVPEVLVSSWERSQAAGVDVSQPRSAFTDDIDPGSLLIRCATPVLDQLRVDIADTPLVVALTDKTARLVQRVDCSPAVARLLDRVEFAPGFDYAEATMGTNGVGTVVEAGRPLSVVGPEHFTEKLQSFACTGAPIIDPITGRVEGVLDISTPAHSWNPLVPTLAKSAAKDISRNLLLDRSRAQQALFDTYLRVTARSGRRAVLAFGHSMFIANPAAQHLFDAAELALLREHATFLMTHRDRAGDTVLLGGRRAVRIQGTRIVVGTEVAGIVVVTDPADTPVRAPAATAPPAAAEGPFGAASSLADGRSPAWLRACAELRHAVAEQQPTLLIGEAGTGKFTLVLALFNAIHPGARHLVIDAARCATRDPLADVAALATGADTPTVCIVRGLDRAENDGIERLRSALTAVESAPGPVWLVATAAHAPTDAEAAPAGLLTHFDAAVTLPPLRCRTDDLAAITTALLSGLAPQRNVRLSPAAQRLIACYGWPRNISQLREALQHALGRRPVGEIQDVDLPGYCRSGSRRALTPLQSAERDAIVAALHDAGSNRVVAAAQLGMARSSLYRKLKTYEITA